MTLDRPDAGAAVPATRAGVAVQQFLRSSQRRREFGLTPHLWTARQLLGQASVVAFRRRLGRDADDRRACQFVRDLARAEKISAREDDLAAHLLRPVPLRLTRDDRRLILAALLLLVSDASDAEVAQLVRAAEMRLARRPGGRRTVSGTPSGPVSIVGQTFKARANYDRALVRALPDEPSEVAALAMVNAAFEAAIARRFGSDRPASAVESFARRVAASSASPLVDDAMVVDLLDGVSDASLEAVMSAKVTAFVQAIEDLGLYESEIDELLVAVESAVTADGVRLTPLPRAAERG